MCGFPLVGFDCCRRGRHRLGQHIKEALPSMALRPVALVLLELVQGLLQFPGPAPGLVRRPNALAARAIRCAIEGAGPPDSSLVVGTIASPYRVRPGPWGE